jgi:hypothetical protein
MLTGPISNTLKVTSVSPPRAMPVSVNLVSMVFLLSGNLIHKYDTIYLK